MEGYSSFKMVLLLNGLSPVRCMFCPVSPLVDTILKSVPLCICQHNLACMVRMRSCHMENAILKSMLPRPRWCDLEPACTAGGEGQCALQMVSSLSEKSCQWGHGRANGGEPMLFPEVSECPVFWEMHGWTLWRCV